jgi:dTDP-4-dehydrorhamnose 3,5-epimerase
MQIEPASIPDVLVIRPIKRGDARGFFSETFKASRLREAGVDLDWVQDNHSYSSSRGVVRGLHFQRPPLAQAKLVRVTRGAIFDVAVDIRQGSPTFGRHVAVELSAENWAQLYVPVGFAHGFCALTDDTEVQYKVSTEYSLESEGGLLWNDSALAIDWPIKAEAARLSPRDAAWPPLGGFTSPFVV